MTLVCNGAPYALLLAPCYFIVVGSFFFYISILKIEVLWICLPYQSVWCISHCHCIGRDTTTLFKTCISPDVHWLHSNLYNLFFLLLLLSFLIIDSTFLLYLKIELVTYKNIFILYVINNVMRLSVIIHDYLHIKKIYFYM